VIHLFLCGDVMTGRGVDQILPHPSAPEIFESDVGDARDYVLLAEAQNGRIETPVEFAYVWGDALELLRDHALDARIINLETSVTRDGWPSADKEVHYRMHPDNVPCLKAARIDACALANNHVLDWGREALVETILALRSAGLKTAGAGPTLAEALQPARLPVGGAAVLVYAFGDASSGIPDTWAASATRSGVAFLPASEYELDALAARIAHDKHAGDIVVASVHWGSNWGYDVEPQQRALARAFVDRGVDVVHGHSSHHPRPIEVYAGKLVLYGCGDFLNDYEGIRGYESFRSHIALAYLPRIDEATGRLLSLRMAPLRTRRMRLEHASAPDVEWLAEVLARVSRVYGTTIVAERNGTLSLGWNRDRSECD
jgi:poly-gamma-glutamate synthesis protein (capsule biosynthesis protein)